MEEMQLACPNMDRKLHHLRSRGRITSDGGFETDVENIREMYGKLDQVRIFSLTQQLSDLKQGNLSIVVIYNKLSALWNELEAVEEKFEGPDSTLRQYQAI